MFSKFIQQSIFTCGKRKYTLYSRSFVRKIPIKLPMSDRLMYSANIDVSKRLLNYLLQSYLPKEGSANQSCNNFARSFIFIPLLRWRITPSVQRLSTQTIKQTVKQSFMWTAEYFRLPSLNSLVRNYLFISQTSIYFNM